MRFTPNYLWLLSLGLGLAACGSGPSDQEKQQAQAQTPAATVRTPDAATVELPAPYASKSVSHRVVIQDWPAGKTPTAPAGFAVAEYAGQFTSPRWLYVAHLIPPWSGEVSGNIQSSWGPPL